MFEVRMAEEVPAVAVVPLNKSNCTLDKRNLKDGSSEVWKHFGYYPSKLKLDANSIGSRSIQFASTALVNGKMKTWIQRNGR